MEGAVSHQSPIDPTSDFFHHLSFVLLDQCYSPLTFFSVAAAAKSLQLCPTLCEPIDGSPPGSPVPGILQARTLEWVATQSSGSSLLRESGGHVGHQTGDKAMENTIQPSHPLSSPSPPAFTLSQHQGLFQ